MTTYVTSNGAAIPFDDQHFAPMRDSTNLLDDPVALRSRFAEDGYVYLRGVLDRAEVLRTRDRYFSTFDPAYLKPGTTPEQGIFSGVVPATQPKHGMAGHPAHEFVRSAAFHAFLTAPALRHLAEVLLDGEVTRLPRSILRHFDRGSRRASRAHVDYTYMDQGSDQLATLWIPIGDCPLRMGGLVYLENSTTVPADQLHELRSVTDRPNDDRPLSHDLGWTARKLGRRWLWADYHAGDVAVHSPHLVHATLDTTTDAIRMSIDVRFQRTDQPTDPRWQSTWSADDGA